MSETEPDQPTQPPTPDSALELAPMPEDVIDPHLFELTMTVVAQMDGFRTQNGSRQPECTRLALYARQPPPPRAVPFRRRGPAHVRLCGAIGSDARDSPRGGLAEVDQTAASK